VITAHRIHGDPQSRFRHALTRSAGQALGFSSRTLTSTTWRPS
jgi:hypothetical protein